MKHAKLILEEYLQKRLSGFKNERFNTSTGAVLLNHISATILPVVNKEFWQRRPSISDDGQPVVVSLKLDTKKDQAIRILVESGSLKMSVAEQISYTLSQLDALIQKLEWHEAVEIINKIISNIFPPNVSDTLSWKGGIWLGAEVIPETSAAELRIYLNLRHGNTSQRWEKLSKIILAYSSISIAPFLTEWIETANPLAIPVGLGIVVSNGVVVGIRAYLGVEDPTLETVLKLMETPSINTKKILKDVHDGFVSSFGPLSRQGVTMGFDFVPLCTKFKRVKVDICCHLIRSEHSRQLLILIKKILNDLSFNNLFLDDFLYDVNDHWGGSSIQFLSLGFAPEFKHATIYVKTGA